MATNKLAVVWAAVSTRAQADEEANSIPTQVREGEEIARRNGWELSPESPLIVPGHSRNYRKFEELSSDARAAGITAFDTLARLLDDKAVGHVIVRDGNRFARRQSLHAFITEWIIIDAGADIYSIYDGTTINDDNYMMWTMNSGYKAAAEVKELVKRRRMGMKKRASRGLAEGSILFTHRAIRDEWGRAQKLVVREEAKPIIQHVYQLLTGEYTFILTDDERAVIRKRFGKDYEELGPDQQLIVRTASFRNLSMRIYQQFGDVHPITSKPFSSSALYSMLYTPLFWGHTVHSSTGRRRRGRLGAQSRWVYDESAPVPAGLTVYRNIAEAGFTGEQAERVKAILAYREGQNVGGHATRGYPFTKMITCGVCGYSLFGQAKTTASPTGHDYRYYMCSSNSNSRTDLKRSKCPNRYVLNEKKIWVYIRAFLQQVLEDEDFVLKIAPASTQQETIATLEAEIREVDALIAQLIEDRIEAKFAGAKEVFMRKIDEAGQRLDALNRRLAIERQDTQSAVEDRHQQEALATLKERGVEATLAMDAVKLNIYLRRLLGKSRLIWMDKELQLDVPDPAEG